MIRSLLVVALLAAPALAAGQSVVGSGVVKDVEMGFVWVGWESGIYKTDGGANALIAYAGFQPRLVVTFSDGSHAHSCYNGPLDGGACVGPLNDLSANQTQCSLVEYWNRGNPAPGPWPYAITGGGGLNDYQNQITEKQNTLLVLISMAALKGLPIQLSEQGGHPDFVADNCFDSVRICFGGTCD
jgi:hypothetical protein